MNNRFISSYKDDVDESIRTMNNEINDIIHKHTREMLHNVYDKLDVYETNLEYIKKMPIFKELYSKIETLTLENESLKNKMGNSEKDCEHVQEEEHVQELDDDKNLKQNIHLVIDEKPQEEKYQTETEEEEEEEEVKEDHDKNENEEDEEEEEKEKDEICELCNECEIYENYKICLNCFVEAETEIEQNEHETEEEIDHDIEDEHDITCEEKANEQEEEEKEADDGISEGDEEQLPTCTICNYVYVSDGVTRPLNLCGDCGGWDIDDMDKYKKNCPQNIKEEGEEEEEEEVKEENEEMKKEEEEHHDKDIYETEDENAYEEGDEGDEGDVGVEVSEITIDNVQYYFEDSTCDVYECLKDGDIGEHIGTYKNEKLYLFSNK